MKRWCVAAGGAVVLLAGAPARAGEPDAKGCKDSPHLSRYPGTHLAACDERGWEEFSFRTAKAQEPVFGRRLHLEYKVDKGTSPPTAPEYLRTYQNALSQAGWTLERTDPNSLVASLHQGEREVWALVVYDRVPGDAHFDVVEKEPLLMRPQAGKPAPRPAEATPDVAGSQDYPAVPRLAFQRISAYEDKPFDSYDFPLLNGRHHAEGRKRAVEYRADGKGHWLAAARVVATYKQALEQEGWSVVAVQGNQLVAQLRNGDKETWLHLSYEASWGGTRLVVVEPGGVKQAVTAESLLQHLNREGHVAFEVHFDTARDQIKPESRPVVAQMAGMLKSSPQLKVEVQGHTDNVGGEKDNQALSERRARSVVAALVASGIDAARLTARGYGQSKPVADNGSEGGRALNRRVELAKR